MPALYVRRLSLKASLSDAEVVEYWRFLMEEAVPAVQSVSGVRSVRVYSGAGALRADIRLVLEMDDAGVYERVLVDPRVRRVLGKTYNTLKKPVCFWRWHRMRDRTDYVIWFVVWALLMCIGVPLTYVILKILRLI